MTRHDPNAFEPALDTALRVPASRLRASILDPERGHVSVPVTMTTPDGEPATQTERWGFNRRYLAEQAQVTPVFRIEMRSPSDPATVRGEDPDAMWVLMPMRV